LKQALLLALIGLGAWSYYTKNIETEGLAVQSAPTSTNDGNTGQYVEIQSQYQCDGRQHCSQMNSYEEAVYFIQNCPNTKMDGDYDGIPCERQFGR
jgi:hypothetical protein